MICIVYYMSLIFFFKQKTAYEMRISDWSSDVCSSDLAFAIGSAFGGFAGSLQAPLVQFIEPGSFAIIHSLKLLLMVVVGGSGFFFGPMLGAAVVIQLGRASCRDRVCQYV